MFCGNCGAALANQNKFCESCGTPVRAEPATFTQAPSPSNAEHASEDRAGLKAEIVIGLVVVGFFVVMALSNNKSSSPESTVQSVPRPTVQTPTAPPNETPPPENVSQGKSLVPPSQQSFTSMIESFIPRYNTADTEIRKTAVRFDRKNAIVDYLSKSGTLQFRNWVGEVNGLTTETDGKAYVSVKLGQTATSIKTWNNSFSDLGRNTMISRGDMVYGSLMDIKEGDEVQVSGTFLAGSPSDYLTEGSLTEEGSMISPEFIVKFSRISKK